MGELTVIMYFGGVWDDSNNYKDYSVRGLILPADCSHEKLVELISMQLKRDVSQNHFILQYQVFEQSPPIPISDDTSLYFYVQLKKAENDKRSYPICVEVLPHDAIEHHDNIFIDALPVNEDIGAIQNNLDIEYDALRYGWGQRNPSIEQMGMELAEYINIQVDDTEELVPPIVSLPNIEEVKRGSVFKSKELVIASVSLLAIRNKFEYRVVKSDTKFYWLKCCQNGCNWFFKSSRTGSIGNFKIRDMNNTHTCSMDSALGYHKQATSFVIANCIKHKFHSSRRVYTPGDAIEDMRHTYGINVSYDKAWRARELAIKMIRGDAEESYGNLPAYLHRLGVVNPGSYTRLETDADGRFLFSFVAFGASIAGWKHCKPVIVVDGTFLTGRYGGTLFIASTQDANNNIFILAFGVGDTENNNAWEWFMLRLKEAYGDREDLCIVSDRHGSIAHAVDCVFPNALHGACTYHLLRNLRKEYGKAGKGIRVPFNAASRAYTIPDFEMNMRKLDSMEEGIREYLEAVGFERWSRAHMTKDRYSTMTSNIAESVNSAIKHAKKYPIEALFECLRCTVQKWFFQNLSDAKSTFTKLATRHDKMLKERIKLSRQLRVNPSSDTVYHVNDETSSYVVDMEERTCTCRRFQLDHMPCPHAVAVIAKRNYSLSDYCSGYFRKEEYILAYSSTIYPLGNKEDWDIPNDIKERIVLAPKYKRQPGRPKENRFKSCLEYKKKTRCGRCDAIGHNVRTCRTDNQKKSCKRKRHPIGR